MGVWVGSGDLSHAFTDVYPFRLAVQRSAAQPTPRHPPTHPHQHLPVISADSMRPSISPVCSAAVAAAASAAFCRAASAARALAASPRLRLAACSAALSCCCLDSCSAQEGRDTRCMGSASRLAALQAGTFTMHAGARPQAGPGSPLHLLLQHLSMCAPTWAAVPILPSRTILKSVK